MSGTDCAKSPSDTPSNAAPVKCVDGCGFWGTPGLANRCSKCHKTRQDVALENGNHSPPSAPPSRESPIPPEVPELATPVDVIDSEEVVSKAPAQKNVKRCYQCNKKHGVLGFKCKCGYVYCDEHRHGSSHECSYQGYQKDAKDQLEKNLNKVQKPKLGQF